MVGKEKSCPPTNRLLKVRLLAAEIVVLKPAEPKEIESNNHVPLLWLNVPPVCAKFPVTVAVPVGAVNVPVVSVKPLAPKIVVPPAGATEPVVLITKTGKKAPAMQA